MGCVSVQDAWSQSPSIAEKKAKEKKGRERDRGEKKDVVKMNPIKITLVNQTQSINVVVIRNENFTVSKFEKPGQLLSTQIVLVILQFTLSLFFCTVQGRDYFMRLSSILNKIVLFYGD